uniref:HORMA domain-containing protein n=1 Tax=Gorilla gorilla gorilla TaxID=9595 RepID=G3RT90_GORGO
MALQLSWEQGITLRGSAEIVAEFFSFGINSILYQRGIYPSETFTRVQKYGLTLLVTTDLELIKYLNNVVEQLKDWLYKCSVQKLSQKAIQDEIRSITATVTFLPLLESGPQFITNSEEVCLCSFTSTIHKVNSMVAYKIPVND